MIRYSTILLVLSLSSASFARAAETEKHPIDAEMERAMDKNSSTAGMVQAAAEAQDKWQKEIDQALGKIRAEMTPEQRKTLEASQRAWRAYVNKELETQGAVFRVMHGTMWRPVSAQKSMEIYRARALLLRSYVDILSERD